MALKQFVATQQKVFCPNCNKLSVRRPHCGKRDCNFYGCSCSGGCLDGCNRKIISTLFSYVCVCQRGRRDVNAPNDETNPADVFRIIDADNDGYISMDEHKRAVRDTGVDLEATFHAMDVEKDGKIAPGEFDADLK